MTSLAATSSMLKASIKFWGSSFKSWLRLKLGKHNSPEIKKISRDCYSWKIPQSFSSCMEGPYKQIFHAILRKYNFYVSQHVNLVFCSYLTHNDQKNCRKNSSWLFQPRCYIKIPFGKGEKMSSFWNEVKGLQKHI